MKTKFFNANRKTRYLALLTTLILFHTLGVGQVWGEPSDSITSNNNMEQIAPCTNNSENPTDCNSMSNFGWGILASGVVAVVALFLFFLILRPRIKIMPVVAYKNVKKSDKEIYNCEVALVNKGFFASNDIRVKAYIVKHNSNESERDEEIAHDNILTLKGYLRNENVSTTVFKFTLPTKGIPEKLKISVLSKHAVSSVEYGVTKVFNVNDFRIGGYEKGIFISAGNTYKQAVMRKNISLFKRIVPCAILFMLIVILVLSVFCSLSVITMLLISLCVLLLLFSVITTWQLYINSKADAYSSVVAHHTFEHIEKQILIGILGTDEEKAAMKKSISLSAIAEDVASEENQENNDNQ